MASKTMTRQGPTHRAAYGIVDFGAVLGDAADVISVEFFGERMSVSVVPDAASSMKLEYTLSSPAEIAADTATWYEWTPGAVATATDGVLDAPVTGVRITAVSGSGKYELLA